MQIQAMDYRHQKTKTRLKQLKIGQKMDKYVRMKERSICL